MMAVNHKVVTNPGHTGLINIGNAAVAVCFIKATLQIEVRLVRGLHDGVIDIRTIDPDPADKVIVLRKQCIILFVGKRRLCCRQFFFVQAGFLRFGGLLRLRRFP